jgi:hypothetical protein
MHRPARGLARGVAYRSWVEPHEAALVLERSVHDVLGMRRTGVLRDVRCARRWGIDAEQLAGLVSGRWLALEALEAITNGRLRVRKPADVDAPMPTLMESWDSLW